jgi:peptide/nickel transport system permease protein
MADQLTTSFTGSSSIENAPLVGLEIRETTGVARADRGRKLGILFWICVGWLALNVLLAVFANLLPLPDPNYQNVSVINAGPAWGHLLGTDDLGRDILSRLIYGARVSLVIGFGAILIGLFLGGTLGLIAGYVRGTSETIFNSAALVLLAFPPLVAIIAVFAFWVHPNDSAVTVTAKITLVIGILASPLLYRVINASTLSYSTREFVTAAKGLGATTWRIIFRELLPNVMPAIVSFALIGVATVIVLEGSLAFLGLSVQAPTPSWGNMIYEGREYLSNNLWLTLFPALAIVSFLLALNFVGDRLRQRFDISEGRL